jgi:heme A synthase
MLSPLFPPPYPPGFEPLQVPLWFAVAAVLSFVVIVFVGILLAAWQWEREERKRTRGSESRPPE